MTIRNSDKPNVFFLVLLSHSDFVASWIKFNVVDFAEDFKVI